MRTALCLLPLLLVLASACGEDSKDDTGEPPQDTQDTGPVDADGDGYPAAYDCDESNPDINPGMFESCNGIDDNCDGLVDPDMMTTRFADTDGDGYGDPGVSEEMCPNEEGWSADNSDCDDSNPDMNPGQAEVCDGIDNDCDADVDEAVAAFRYADVDGDGYGDASTGTKVCTSEPGWVDDDTDCNDADAAIYPSALEMCNGYDDNCNGMVDGVEAEDSMVLYDDRDGDGWGDDATGDRRCPGDIPTTTTGGDCDDSNSSVFPGAEEICNGLDDDCSGVADGEDAAGTLTLYRDMDGDGWGEDTTSTVGCPGAGWVSVGGDCNDRSATTHPDADEICDTKDTDENCNGLADDSDSTTDLASMSTWYTDLDGDAWGDDATGAVTSCEVPDYGVKAGGDCDDTDPGAYGGADELCNGIDDDCDGDVDDSPVDIATFYLDADGDGWGTWTDKVTTCDAAPTGYVDQMGDCDDSDPDASPDTGCTAWGWSGTWTGDWVLDVVMSLFIMDTCAIRGMTLTVDEAAIPQVTGSGECEYEGYLAWFVASVPVTLEGNLTSGTTVEGTVLAGSFVDTTWTGTIAEPGVLKGSFSGSGIFDTAPYDYTGTMEFTR